MQQEQLDILKKTTGANFNFVPAGKDTHGIKYYTHHCTTDQEYQDIAGVFNGRNFDNGQDVFFYTCLEHSDGTCEIVVFENRLDKLRMENIMRGRIKDKTELLPIGNLHGNDVYLELMPTLDNRRSGLVARHQRGMAVVNINGMRLPFYVSSGISGKESQYGISSGKWYPLQGVSDSGWLNKMPDMKNNPYPELDAICELLEKKYPAAQVKQDALDGKLPLIGQQDLLEYANSSFPEGTPFNERSDLHKYYKNFFVYLPDVMNTWKSGSSDFLKVSKGPLLTSNQKVLKKVRGLGLLCGISLDNATNSIWFEPATFGDVYTIGAECCFTEQEIKNQLWRHGIDTGITMTANNRPGFGIPVDSVAESLANNRAQQVTAFQNGIKNIQQSAPERPEPAPKKAGDTLAMMFKKLKSSLDL